MHNSENTTTLPKVNNKPSRRAVLKAGAALVTAGTAAAPAMALADPHPDAELLKAWEAFLAGYQAFDTVPDNDEAHEPIWERIDAAAEKIRELPAYTHAGYAVKCRYLFQVFDESLGGQRFAQGEKDALLPETLGDMPDCRHKMLWKMVEQAESMGGAA